MSSFSRRDLLKMTGGAALSAGQLAAGSASAANSITTRTLTYASWGGEFQDAQKASYCDPFEAKTGTKVIQEFVISNARIRLMLESSNPDWDVICSDDYVLEGLDKSALAKVDTSIVDLSKIYSQFRWEYGPGCVVGATVLAYSTEALGAKKLGSMDDLFDLKKYPGKRMLYNGPNRNLEIALLADGVPRDKLYPLDVDRAFKKLATIREHTIFYQSHAQSQQLIVDGGVTCGTMYVNRAFGAVTKGAKLAIDWSNNIRNVTLHIVPKGGAHTDIAWQLVKETLEPESQAKYASMQGGSPTNPDALKLIKPELLPWMATAEGNMKQGWDLDSAYWGKYLAPLTERWQAWLLE